MWANILDNKQINMPSTRELSATYLCIKGKEKALLSVKDDLEELKRLSNDLCASFGEDVKKVINKARNSYNETPYGK